MRYILQKSVVFTILLAASLLLVFCTDVLGAEFPDVATTHKNYSAVTELVEIGVIAGYDDGYFRPEKEITRTEFCALMARTLGYDKEGYIPQKALFTDVKDGYWGEAYISFCYEKGLINGMGNNEFWPADKVTLAQATKMAVCAIGKQDEALSNSGEKWYDGYVETATDYDLLEFIDGQVDNAAMRGDIAQIVYNMIETGFIDLQTDEETDLETDEETDQTEDTDNEEAEEDHISQEIRDAYRKKDFSDVKTILIDAGHNYSGSDTGAENKEFDLKEERITWNIADKLRKRLEDLGYEVIMTRPKMTDSISNTSVIDSLQARVDLGHESLADLFISIHCNAGGGSGTEVYCFQKGGYAYRLAKLVQENIVDSTALYDRGVKTANFFTIKNTLMPAVLVETGFIDNKKDIEVISTEDGQDKIAEAIAIAVVEYDDMPPIEKIEKEKEGYTEDDEETGIAGTGGQSQQA